MIITNAGIKSKYPTAAQFLFTDIWFEAELMEGEDPKEGVLALIRLADESHKAAYPHMYPNNEKIYPLTHSEPETLAVQQVSKTDNIQNIIQQISEITDPVVLKSFGFMQKRFPEVAEAYEQKEKELNIKK